MGILRTKTIEPATGSTLTLGASGDTITVSSDSIKVNTFKDAGGNTLFTSDGAGTLSSINSALVPYGPILISTATASNASSVAITSGITSTYDEYMFVMTDIHSRNNDVGFKFQVNAAGQTGYNETVTSTYFQAWHDEADSAVALEYKTGSDLAQGTDEIMMSHQGSDADQAGAIILHLFSPASTTYVKHYYFRCGSYQADDRAYNEFGAGYINTTAAIDEIKFIMSSGNFDGVIQMYGIK